MHQGCGCAFLGISIASFRFLLGVVTKAWVPPTDLAPKNCKHILFWCFRFWIQIVVCVCSCLLLLSLFAWFLTRWTWHRSRLRWFHFVWPKHPLWTLFLHLNSCSGNHQDLTHSLSLTIYTGLLKIRLSQTVFLINGLPCLRRKCRCLHAFDMELVFGAWAGSSWQSMARNSIVAPGTPIHPSSQFASAYWNCLDVLPCTVLLADVFLSLRHSCKFIISFF